MADNADNADDTVDAADTEKTAEPTGPSEDMKAKFREALDKKHSHGGKDVSSDDSDKSKVHGAHGPAKAQQMFRRKSGS